MALEAADLISPYGIIQAAWFPELSEAELETQVGAWLTAAESKTEDEAAQQAFVYCAALRAAAATQGRLESVQIDGLRIKRSFSAKDLLAQADAWCADYGILTSTSPGAVITTVGYE